MDIDAVAPLPADRGAGRDEVGQVGEALVAVHRTALKAAADRAEALSGISGVYVSLAHRSQLLVHRQLALLDTMERRTEDPAELEDLFRLDHLTTRMRRHAESLIILSGAAPGRGWRHPVPLLDVVRAAVAEVEDFARVEVSAVAEVRLAGGAVADLTHLLAELVENAVTFSPPHTKVQVHAERVGTGLALEIHDRGLGMSTEALDEANRRIADADEIDLLDTERLGLFVVNRLAHRQQARVTLQPSAYGGVTAVVLLPDDVLAEAAPDDGGAPEEMTSLYHRRRPARARALGAAISRPAALPAAPEPPVAGTAPAPEAPMSERPAPPEPAPADLDGPLPRRVRQASLAPDLRDEPQHKPEWVPRTEVTAAPRRSPEQARATMASLRAGWTRGRAATAPRDGAHGPITPDDATPDDATPDDAAPGHDPQGETAP